MHKFDDSHESDVETNSANLMTVMSHMSKATTQ